MEMMHEKKNKGDQSKKSFMLPVICGFLGYVSAFILMCSIDTISSKSYDSVESTEIDLVTEQTEIDLVTEQTETESSMLNIYDTPDYHKYLGVCWCSECNKPNLYDVKYCESCGAEHTEDWYTYQYAQCPTCGEYITNASLNNRINHCSECGAEVGQPTKVLQKDILKQED